MANTVDGALVEAARAGDQRAFGQLFDTWFDRVHDVSRRIVHDDGIAGEVAQDTFLRAWTKLDTLDDVDAFGGWVLRIGRNASLNRLEKERRSTVLDDESMTAVTDAGAPDHDPLARMDQAARVALVWDAAAALGERDASVLDLHLRHSLGAAELADELGTNANNAHQMLFTLRKRLGNAVRALVLWRAGHPTCADLRASLADAGLTSFGAPMVKAIDRHVDRCDACAEDRTERLSPAALFAAAPIVAAPTLLKAKAAAALGEAGVPMAGSSAAASAASAPGIAGPTAGPMAAPGAPVGPVGGAVGGAAGAGPGDAGGSGDGSGGDGSGGDGSGTADDDGSAARSALARRRVLVAAALVAVVCLGAALWWATRSDDDTDLLTMADLTETTVASTLAGGVPVSTTTIAGGSSTTVAGGPAPSSDPGPPDPSTPAPGSPTTAPPPTTTTMPPTTTTTLPPPVIDRFTATPTTTVCRGGYLWGVVWETTGADAVTVGPTAGASEAGDPDSKAAICAPADTSFTLDATGAGGTTSATVQGQGPTTTTTVVIID